MMTTLLKVGQFFRLLDESGHISLTNLGMYVALYKLLTTTGSYAEIATFFVAAASYSFKKVMDTNV